MTVRRQEMLRQMITEAAFLQTLVERPTDETTWLVLGDWLEETGQTDRRELLNLQIELRRENRVRKRATLGRRVQELLGAGVKPLVPILTNSLNMQLALIPAGLFLMGSSRNTSGNADEIPQRVVEITRPFFLGIHQVTQKQFEQIAGRNPSHFGPQGRGREEVEDLDGGSLPVENVSYQDIQKFLRQLNKLPSEKKANRSYRLPTEAEWEYACRGGITHTSYSFGKRLPRTMAQFDSTHPQPVGSFPSNLFGIHDMHGNAWEWCSDWYEPNYYTHGPRKDPTGPATGHRRVLRGGAWSSSAELCRSAIRGHNLVTARHTYNGFRVVLSVGED